MTRLDNRQLHRARHHQDAAAEADKQSKSDDEGGNESQGALDAYTLNLNALAKAGKIDPLIGREHELERVIQVLCRRRKNNPLLVGEAGVGKTAIARASRAGSTKATCPSCARRYQVYSLDIRRAAGRHQVPRRLLEQRLKAVLEQLAESPKSILFIDEIRR
ncbi:MAG: AAA family ATPase [Burkholderiales bacterium]